jgi:transposase
METSISGLYEDIVGVAAPWVVTAVIKDDGEWKTTIRIEYGREESLVCPVCGGSAKRYDHRRRRLRYLDTCQYETFLEVHVPRVKRKEDEVEQIGIPFAEKHSRFERAVTAWLRDSPISAVAENFNLSWDEVDGIMQRAVKRGLERRREMKPQNIGIDETSYRKEYDYVTVIVDKDGGYVIDVIFGHDTEGVKGWFAGQKGCDFSGLRSILMDMWDAYIKAVKESLEGWERPIAFDRFHVAKHFTEVVDKVRRREHAGFMREPGESPLTRSRFDRPVNLERRDNRSGKRF